MPFFKVRGPQLLWNQRPVLLRGVATGDPTLARRDRPTSDYATIARDWGANTVRLGLHPRPWKADPRGALDTLARDIAAARNAGLFVIVDWHAIGWPDGRSARPDLYDCRVALAEGFWDAAAGRFGRDPGVLFELWNEPTRLDAEFKRGTPPAWPELKPVWERLQRTVRRRSPNPILVTGGAWAHDLRGIAQSPLADPAALYSWHVYAGNEGDDPARWAALLDGVDRIAPVVVTEWGFQRATAQHYQGTAESFGNRFVRNFLTKRRLHATAWCWHPTWGPPLLESDWTTPTEFGRYVKGWLKTGRGAVGAPRA